MSKRPIIFYCPWTKGAGCAHGANCLARRKHDAEPTKVHACYGWGSQDRKIIAEVRKFQNKVGKPVGPLLPKRSLLKESK